MIRGTFNFIELLSKKFYSVCFDCGVFIIGKLANKKGVVYCLICLLLFLVTDLFWLILDYFKSPNHILYQSNMAPIPEDLRDFVKNMNNDNKVMIWSKSYCPFCNKVRMFSEFASFALKQITQQTFACSKSTIETLERRCSK